MYKRITIGVIFIGNNAANAEIITQTIINKLA